ncbi:MAG: phenylacetate--CoA ligase family protein, partial [Anaerolineales bacterium]
MHEFILFDIFQDELERENARLPHEDKSIPSQHGLLNTLWDIWRARRGGKHALTTRREHRLANLIAFARARSPFYQNLYRQLPAGIHEIQELPPVSKPDLMESFDDWVTDPKVTKTGVDAFVTDTDLVGNYYLDQYALWTTSGTTGEPGVFVHDGDALNIYAALGLLRGINAWMTKGNLWAFLRRDVRVAIVIATGGHWASDAVKELVRGLHPSISDRIHTYSVLTPLHQMVKSLNDYQPTILIGYPTALTLLANQQVVGGLKISPLLVVTAAEWLTPGARDQIAGAFDCLVRETYAATEFMGIAYSCDHGRLHVNSDWVILEPVNEAYQPVPPGQPSQTALLTNLANRVQP